MSWNMKICSLKFSLKNFIGYGQQFSDAFFSVLDSAWKSIQQRMYSIILNSCVTSQKLNKLKSLSCVMPYTHSPISLTVNSSGKSQTTSRSFWSLLTRVSNLSVSHSTQPDMDTKWPPLCSWMEMVQGRENTCPCTSRFSPGSTTTFWSGRSFCQFRFRFMIRILTMILELTLPRALFQIRPGNIFRNRSRTQVHWDSGTLNLCPTKSWRQETTSKMTASSSKWK